MNLISCWLSFCMTISFTKAYGNYKAYDGSYKANDCVLGKEPVCGTNGHELFRLDNACELIKFNSKQLEKGQMALSKTSFEFCNPPPTLQYKSPSKLKPYCPQYCNKIPKPLCASYQNEQRNFTNECELKKHICETKENWQIILNDTCVTLSCPLDGQEICASLEGTNKTFPNLLSLYMDIQTKGKNWEILNVGPCPCPEDYRPICAQLNCTTKTFTNECFLEKEVKNGSLWTLLFFGECPQLPSPNAAVANDEADLDEGVESGDGPLDIDALIDSTLNEIKEENKKPDKTKPIYVVKNNQILPYNPQLYPATEPPKPKDYYAFYTPVKSYKDPYEIPPGKPYTNSAKPLYVEPKIKMYPKYDYAASAKPPDYQSFFKPLNTPYKVATMAVASSYTNRYYAPKPSMDYHYSQDYHQPLPVAKKCYETAVSYEDDDELYDSLFESFT